MSIPLGPFQLRHPVGQGGMGVVWLGRHTGQDVPVAVKVLTHKQTNASVYHRAFLQEVRAVSALDHPGIVWIFDSGSIPADTARASGGQLVEGSPYLVMEYASRGTLRSLGRPLTWRELKAVLLSLLDALAHAHARGVLHRDLKPDNVLIAGREDLRPGFKITDFGIAHPMDESLHSLSDEDRPVGTPQYMAPEQVRSEPHVYGPHTDLYSLGCLAWRLASGRVPFHGLKGASLMYAQLTKDPPALVPAYPMPDGLEAFLRILLRKEPHDRFQRAADAAVALSGIPDPGGESATTMFRLDALPGLEPEDPADAVTAVQRIPLADPAGDSDEIEVDTATLEILTRGGAVDREVHDPSVRPRIPSTWRLPRSFSRPTRLVGAGLGLFGLRPVPYVGRQHERDVLWRALGEVHRAGRARAVVVRGEAGVGRSRLVDWIADRAHEVGGAHLIRASFSSPATAREQIRRALVQFLRSFPLDRGTHDRRVLELSSGWSLPGLGLADTVDALMDGERVPLGEAQRNALVRRVWELVAEDRPVVVVLDDAQWGPEALDLVRGLLDAQEARPSRILAVATVLDAEVGPHTEAGRLLATLSHRAGVEVLALEPLRGRERADLVREILVLEEPLVEAIAARTGGNPLFAVQLVGDQVERGKLVTGPAGFTLADPAAPLPDTLAEVWDGRVRQLVRGLVAPALQMLERAAVLGREVDVLEWQAACDDPRGAHAATGMLYFNPRHARLRQGLMDRLLATGLGHESPVGFVFAHAQLHEALVERSKLAGRFREHALACANALRHRHEEADAERLGRYLIDAGRPDEAIEPLITGAAWIRRRKGSAAALVVLDAVEATLKAAHVPRADRRWAELYALRAADLQALGQHDQAEEAALRAASLSEAWTDLSAGAATVLGAVARARGALSDAEERLLLAVRLLGEDGDACARIRAWHELWRLSSPRGQDVATRARAAEVAAIDPPDALARTMRDAAMAEHALWAAELDEARDHAERALEGARGLGDLSAQAQVHQLLASVADQLNRLAEARDHLWRAIELLDEVGSARAMRVRCRLAWLDARLGHFAGAQAAVEPGLAREVIDPAIRALAHLCLAMASAGRARWEPFDRHLGACGDLDGLARTEPELGAVAELAGELALKRRQRGCAVRAWTLARSRFEALGDRDRAEQVRYRLATM